MARPRVVAIVGPTATGKSALGIALAHRFNGEIVSCDSTAVYRRFDIGTDKVPIAARQGIPHHLIDVVEPTEEYSAARYAREAGNAIRAISARGKLPIVVGGTGLYYRALIRGFFPGPARNAELRARLERIADRKGTERLHTMLGRIDPVSAARIHCRDRKRLVRALEVFFLTGRPLTSHFTDTQSPIPDYDVTAFGLQIDPELTAARVAARVDAQFRQGLLAEIRAILASGIPETAHPFSGLVYRQALEHLHGERDEPATRELIVRENRKYSRRQLIWFRKEPNLQWIHAAGEGESAREQATRILAALEMRRDAHYP